MSIESYKWLMKSIEYPLKVKCLKFVSVAQLVEQSTFNAKVRSSSLLGRTNSQMAIYSFLLERTVSL